MVSSGVGRSATAAVHTLSATGAPGQDGAEIFRRFHAQAGRQIAIGGQMSEDRIKAATMTANFWEGAMSRSWSRGCRLFAGLLGGLVLMAAPAGAQAPPGFSPLD